MSQRILVLQSVEDEITYRREMRIKRSPLLRDYNFKHIYAIELKDEQQELPTPLMMEQVVQGSLDGEELLDRLVRKVIAFDPNILIVHAGFVFHRFPHEMISALKSLKDKFPNLRIGIQSRIRFGRDRPELQTLFEDSEEIRGLIERIF